MYFPGEGWDFVNECYLSDLEDDMDGLDEDIDEELIGKLGINEDFDEFDEEEQFLDLDGVETVQIMEKKINKKENKNGNKNWKDKKIEHIRSNVRKEEENVDVEIRNPKVFLLKDKQVVEVKNEFKNDGIENIQENKVKEVKNNTINVNN